MGGWSCNYPSSPLPFLGCTDIYKLYFSEEEIPDSIDKRERMICAYEPWVQASISYPPQLKRLNQVPNLSITKTKTQAQRKSLDNRFDDIEGDDKIDNGGGSWLMKFTLPSHVKSITSTSNPFIKHCLKLKSSSSYRHSHASALVVGTSPLR